MSGNLTRWWARASRVWLAETLEVRLLILKTLNLLEGGCPGIALRGGRTLPLSSIYTNAETLALPSHEP